MESGDFNCCKAAYGYELIDGQLYINEAEAVVIRRIFDLYLQGCGKQAIANQLNTDGIPRRYGYKTWHLNAIHYILNNERYMGRCAAPEELHHGNPCRSAKEEIAEKSRSIMWRTVNPAIVSRGSLSGGAGAFSSVKLPGDPPQRIATRSAEVLEMPCLRSRLSQTGDQWYGLLALALIRHPGAQNAPVIECRRNMVKEAFMRMSGKLADNRERTAGRSDPTA